MVCQSKIAIMPIAQCHCKVDCQNHITDLVTWLSIAPSLGIILCKIRISWHGILIFQLSCHPKHIKTGHIKNNYKSHTRKFLEPHTYISDFHFPIGPISPIKRGRVSPQSGHRPVLKAVYCNLDL